VVSVVHMILFALCFVGRASRVKRLVNVEMSGVATTRQSEQNGAAMEELSNTTRHTWDWP